MAGLFIRAGAYEGEDEPHPAASNAASERDKKASLSSMVAVSQGCGTFSRKNLFEWQVFEVSFVSMIGSLRQPWWMVLCFCVGCEPSATQSSAIVPMGASSEQPVADAAPVQSTPKEGSPRKTWDKTIFVREKRVDCEGEGPRLCLQVRATNSEEWQLFYGRIEGFSYEEGFLYELRVKVEGVQSPPADGSSQRLHLVEVVSKQKVTTPVP